MSAGARGACISRSIMPTRLRRRLPISAPAPAISTRSCAGPGDIDLILATDAEQIPGIGEWGVGGIEVSIGKLAIYTAAGGIDPTRVIPVMLDVGTNRENLLDDPMYPGNRHGRVR